MFMYFKLQWHLDLEKNLTEYTAIEAKLILDVNCKIIHRKIPDFKKSMLNILLTIKPFIEGSGEVKSLGT
jgi:hypothetical protein